MTSEPPADDEVVVLDQETAVKDPAVTGTAAVKDPAVTGTAAVKDPAVTGTAAVKDPAVTGTAPAPASTGGISAQRWSEILAAFVDDPRGSAQMAAEAVDSAIDEFVTSVRARQRALASSWEGSEADTEQLRTAVREYRRFWHQVQEEGLTGKPGP
jgi:hypothetical protein